MSKEKPKCHLTDSDGNEITSCVICGAEFTLHKFVEVEMLYGEKYAVQILECKECGCPSFGWFKIEDETEE